MYFDELQKESVRQNIAVEPTRISGQLLMKFKIDGRNSNKTIFVQQHIYADIYECHWR